MKDYPSNITDNKKTIGRIRLAFLRLLLIAAILGGPAGCGSGGGSGGGSSESSPIDVQDTPTQITPPPDSTPISEEDGTNTPPPGRVVPLGLIREEQPAYWGQSLPVSINEAGDVIGTSHINNVSAWLYSEGITRNIDWPVDDDRDALLASCKGFNLARGCQSYNFARGLNNHGAVVGNTQLNFDPPFDPSHVLAWLYKDGFSIELGLMDHEDANPRHYAGLINDAGQVAGSTTWSHGDSDSVSAWLYSDGATHSIPLTDQEQTSSNGSRNSTPTTLNQNGEVAGIAARYDEDGEPQGNSCWVYSNGSTNKAGLYGPQHRDTDTGEKICWVLAMNNAGQVAGGSTRYPPEVLILSIEADGELVEGIWGQFDGASAWLNENGTTVNIGLVDNKHTSPNGMQRSEVAGLNEAGQVIGFSYSFEQPLRGSWAGSDPKAVTAWLYEDGAHTRLGLTNTNHTAPDGVQFSAATAINEAGLVAGYSLRYIEEFYPWSCTPTRFYGCGPNTSWLYDPALDETVVLVSNQTGYVGKHRSVRSDGFSDSYVTYLSEKGDAYGYYSAYVDGAFSEWRIFYYSRAHGLRDLMDMIPELEQWKPIQPIKTGNSSGYLVGAGTGPEGDGSHVGLLIAPLEFQDEN